MRAERDLPTADALSELHIGQQVTVRWPHGAEEQGVLERAESWTVTFADGSCEVVETEAIRSVSDTGDQA